MSEKEIKQIQAENERLKEEVSTLKDEMIRLVRRNLELTERMEEDIEQRRRVEVARELLEGNIQRQRNADLQDDGQLMALIDIRLEDQLDQRIIFFKRNGICRLIFCGQNNSAD